MFAIRRLPYIYKALKSTDVKQDLFRLRDEGAAGVSISMPFKTQVLDILDYSHPYVTKFNSCNSIKIIDNKFVGHNTDAAGATYSISQIAEDSEVSILGNGAMATMFKKMLGDRATIFSRKTGNWDDRYKSCDVIINCTALGTISKDSPFDFLPTCNKVIDLAIGETQLELQCYESDVKYVRGITFYMHQFREQFKFYTGIEINIEDIENL